MIFGDEDDGLNLLCSDGDGSLDEAPERYWQPVGTGDLNPLEVTDMTLR